MIYPVDFVSFIRKRVPRAEERVVMARIALNALYDPDLYPVDVSELMSLCNENRVMAEAFLAYCAINPVEYSSWDGMSCEELFAICADARKDQSPEALLQEIDGPQPAASSDQNSEGAHACL